MGEAERSAVEGDTRPKDAAQAALYVQFFNDQYSKVVGMIILEGGSVQEAEDAVMHAFEDTYKHWMKIGNPKAYVRTAAKRSFYKACDMRRRYPSMPATEMGGEVSDCQPDGLLEDITEYAWVEWVIKDLPPVQQQVMRGIVEGLSNEQVASLLGTNPTNVRSHLRHVRNRLQQRLDLIAMVSSPSRNGATSASGEEEIS